MKKKITLSRSELLNGWLFKICSKGYVESYIGEASVDFYDAIDALDTSGEFNIIE